MLEKRRCTGQLLASSKLCVVCASYILETIQFIIGVLIASR